MRDINTGVIIMFCTACGNQIAADQAVCTKCGAATSLGLMQRGSGGRRVADHTRLLSIHIIVYSSLIVFAAFVTLFMSRFVIGHLMEMPHNGPPPPPFVMAMI